MSDAAARPLTLLIAALGGEGGGVLAGWIEAAAANRGYAVQGTSIPGVAQRTGATTYYIEMLPSQAGANQPVLALMPGIGEVDILVASELLEAGRTVASGLVTPDRTFLIASTHRVLAMTEKTAMGDGRLDAHRLAEAIETQSRRSLLFDMEETARESGAMINAVMLGALAGSGALPIPAEAFALAIREEGRGVEASLRGFQAGLAKAAELAGARGTRGSAERVLSWRGGRESLESLERDIDATPPAAQAIIREGVRRLVEYQDPGYARLYLDRLAPVRAADDAAMAEGALLRETARHLAVRMSFEDVIRVAAAKIERGRLRRIREELGAKPGEPIRVFEFFKPGIEEICSLLPSFLARPILAASTRRGWLGWVYWGMEIETTSILGFLRLATLARLRRWRRMSHRFREEQAAIEAWLALICRAAAISGALALEIAECARLIKGYGETHHRGSENFRAIEARVIRPALAGDYAPAVAVDAIASARMAALADPEGRGLARCLDELERRVPLRAVAE